MNEQLKQEMSSMLQEMIEQKLIQMIEQKLIEMSDTAKGITWFSSQAHKYQVLSNQK